MYHSIKRFLIGKPLKSQAAGEQKTDEIKSLGNAFLRCAVICRLWDRANSNHFSNNQCCRILVLHSDCGRRSHITARTDSFIQANYLRLSAGRRGLCCFERKPRRKAGVDRGGSLLVDYILTVAVSISAGTDAITSAFPALHDYHVPIAIFLVLVIMILNLRGLSESASILAYPVYLFVVALLVLIAVGLFKLMTGQMTSRFIIHRLAHL